MSDQVTAEGFRGPQPHTDEPIEYSKYIPERQSRELIVIGRSEALRGFKAYEESKQSNYKRQKAKFINIAGATQKENGNFYHTTAHIGLPGFFARAIAKVRNKEPRATLHVAENTDPLMTLDRLMDEGKK